MSTTLFNFTVVFPRWCDLKLFYTMVFRKVYVKKERKDKKERKRKVCPDRVSQIGVLCIPDFCNHSGEF